MVSSGSKLILHSGMPLGAIGHLVVKRADAERPLILVAKDDRRAEAMIRSIRFFSPEMPVYHFPAWDCLPYDRVSPNADVSARRVALLFRLSAKPKGRFALVTTLNAVTQYVPHSEYLAAAGFRAQNGKAINVDALRAYLVRMGFHQVPTVTEQGDY
ncbi:MAG: transcription-repair coupling factor, partial [Pseudomonadota bacterium]